MASAPSPSGLPASETGTPANPAVAVPGASAVAPPSAGAIGAAAAPEKGALPPSSGPAPIASSALIGSTPSWEGPMDRAADLPPVRGSIRPSPQTPRAAAAAPATAFAAAATTEAAPAARERISVSSMSAQPRLNPTLSQAYTTLQSGDIEQARSLYSNVVQSEPMNIDALLGLAYISAQENRTDDATRFYMRILQLNPRHAAAQAALIGLMGRADPVASESRLKQLISREPSAFLYFVLGNLYSDQSLWAQAQQSYFQAHSLEPDNPDYAYNLAIGLDHLRQNKLALNFYRRAEQLASSQGRSNFNLSHARERIASLSSQLE
jgi:tetratricopeptide (TPR) repeat protein